MRKTLIMVVIVLILVQLLSFSAFAATDSDGFSLWSAIDAIGTFFANLGNLIKDWLIRAMEFLLNGLKTLFIPRDDYFPRMMAEFDRNFSSKFGAIIDLSEYLKTRLGDLRSYRGDLLVLKFPKEHLFGGWSLDILKPGSAIAEMIRGAFSGFVVLSTVIFSYKKVIAMINT